MVFNMSFDSLGTWASPSNSKSTSNDHPTVNPTSLCIKSDTNGQFLVVTCGNAEGNFYPAKLKKGSPSSKCIWYNNSTWCSLVEFESFGGKSKSKNWKRTLRQ